jgi:hypothetical protein
MIDQIEAAFAHRQRPELLTERPVDDSDYEDAIWFRGRDWREIRWEDWEHNFSAFFAFTPEAFVYFLPSILTLSVCNPNDILLVATSLESVLANGLADPNNGPFLRSRLSRLAEREYDAIFLWLKWMSAHHREFREGSHARARATLELLRASANR